MAETKKSEHKHLTYTSAHGIKTNSMEKSEEALIWEGIKQVVVKGEVLNSYCQL